MKHYLYPGVDVRLRVDGIDLAEYDIDDLDEDEEVNTVTKYVEATAGAKFAVNFTATSESARDPRDVINMDVYLDGKCMLSKVYTINSQLAVVMGLFNHVLEGIETNTAAGMVLEKFAFAELQTTDAPAKAARQKQEEFKHLGEISIKCTWARKTDAAYAKPEDRPSRKPKFDSGVPEKCLKGRAISNHTTLGAPEPRAGRVTYVTVSWPYGKAPFAVFNFKYRSRKDLQIEGVIPRSPSPVPLEERDPDQLSPEEMRQLLRRMREREASAVRVKREGERREKRARSTTVTEGDDDDDELEITAGPSKRRQTSGDSAVEIVDLTDD